MSHEGKKSRNPLVSAILLQSTPLMPKPIAEKVALLRREKTEVPVIYIGAGTCGMVAGAADTLQMVRNYLDDHRLKAEIVEVGCIGLCSAEPILDVQLPGKTRISFKNITAEKVYTVLDGAFNNNYEPEDVLGQFAAPALVPWEGVPFVHELPFFKNQKRLVLENCGVINPSNIEEYIARGGYRSYVKALMNYTGEEICDIIELSGLRGRGGGGFSTGKKWKIARNTQSDQKYLICNADESDPGAFMDRALIEGDPHRLIEGIAIAAYAIGASQAFIYIRAEYKRALESLKVALQQAKEYGLTGPNVYDSGVNLYISLKVGSGAFVCGEETALDRKSVV